MRKNLHGRILKGKLKEQHLSTVPKSFSYIYIYIYVCVCFCKKIMNSK